MAFRDKNYTAIKSKVSERYIGTWFEIALYPNRFQKDCLSSTATCNLPEDRKIEVLNRSNKEVQPGRTIEARVKAWVVDYISKAKLKVLFSGQFGETT